MLTRCFSTVAAALFALLVVAQLHHTVDGTPTRWTDTHASQLPVGPYQVRVPAGWRDARELAIVEIRDHVIHGTATTLVPEDMPARGDTVAIAWRPASDAPCATPIHVGADTGCMSLDGTREVIAIHHGDHDLVLTGDVAACDEAVAGLTLATPGPAPARPSV